MVKDNREDRRRKILTGIIKTYIDTAMPVASKALVYKYRLDISPATVRNIMAELEDLGYLTHLHTSSGRIPTDKGYRYYVDMVMDEEQLAPSEKKKILMRIINTQWDEVGRLLENALNVISDYTQQMSMLLHYRIKNIFVEKIDLIYINRFKILFIIVADNGDVLHLFIENENMPSIEKLANFLNFVNRELKGHSVYDISSKIKNSMLLSGNSSYHVFSSLFNLLIKSLENMEEKTFMHFGVGRIIQYPEFQDAVLLHHIMGLLDKDSPLVKILEADIKGSDVNIHIGREDVSYNLENCCIISSKYGMKNRVLGAIGVLGPTRLPYGRTISVVKYVSDVLTQALESAIF
ncbi:MAG: heat-inducible transcriptional repressor HrcA [Candidatus Omnitrophica bacterium]|nr:heat-inducible transcriptional repressor HrcA [Candidatus Omnitrophota bacterium]